SSRRHTRFSRDWSSDVCSSDLPVLILPTLRLVSVSEVRDMTGDEPRVLTGWRMSQAGMLSRRGGWPSGFGAVEVDVVHGYEQCRAEGRRGGRERTSWRST